MDYRTILDDLRAEFCEILGDNLVGMYVHGSIAFGCFRWETSDIDFLLVVRDAPPQREKVRIIQTLLAHAAPPKGFEMSVVTLDACRSFVHPTPFELHFSNTHLARCRADVDAYCRDMHGLDPDLAAHFSVVREAGIVWHGLPVEAVFAPVPRDALLDSILSDVEDADILADPVYFTLNLCRVLACKREGAMLSKAGGGQWGLAKLPQAHHAVIRQALDSYEKGSAAPADELMEFRDHMLREIFGA